MFNDDARAGRRKLDCRLVGHHLDHWLVLNNMITDCYQPFADLSFGEPLADVRQSELEPWHALLASGRDDRLEHTLGVRDVLLFEHLHRVRHIGRGDPADGRLE